MSSDTTTDPPVESRRYRRYTIWFPVTITVGDGGAEIWAICRDASPGGVLVSATSPLDVGTKVEARFRVSPDSASERTVAACVVRHETPADELMLAFPYRVALAFEAAVPDLLAELARCSERNPTA